MRSKFPWLPVTLLDSTEEKRKAQPSGGGDQRRRLPEIPNDVWRHLTAFLDDDALFELRRVSTVFYEAYYSQRVLSKKTKFNALRALILGYQGRIFRNLEQLNITEACFEATDPREVEEEKDGWALPRFRFRPESFPRLHTIRDAGDPDTTALNFVVLPAFLPKLRTLRRVEISSDDLFHISSAAFPNLEHIVIQHNQGEFPHMRHKNVHTITFVDDTWPQNLEDISKERFPKIKLVRINRAQQQALLNEVNSWGNEFQGFNEDLDQCYQRLRDQGIEVCLVDMECPIRPIQVFTLENEMDFQLAFHAPNNALPANLFAFLGAGEANGVDEGNPDADDGNPVAFGLAHAPHLVFGGDQGQ